MNAILPIRFAAEWTEQNRHLRERTLGDYSLSEIVRIALVDSAFTTESLIKAAIGRFVGKNILVSTSFPQAQTDQIREVWERRWAEGSERRRDYDPFPLELTTPDGVTIRGTFYRDRLAREIDIPTVVMHQPNAGLHKGGMEEIFLEHRGFGHFNIVSYDYRGVGESRGEEGDEHEPLSAQQLALDGETVHQCLRANLGISERNIRHFGLSLGGGVSAMVRAIHPSQAPYVNWDSFSSLTDIVDSHSIASLRLLFNGQPSPEADVSEEIFSFNERFFPPWLAHFLNELFTQEVILFTFEMIKSIVNWILRLCDWDFNVVPALRAIGENARVVYDPEDEVIVGGSAHRVVDERQQLEIRPADPAERRHHCHSLHESVGPDGRPADLAVVRFLTAR